MRIFKASLECIWSAGLITVDGCSGSLPAGCLSTPVPLWVCLWLECTPAWLTLRVGVLAQDPWSHTVHPGEYKLDHSHAQVCIVKVTVRCFLLFRFFFLYFYLFLAFRFISYFSNNVWSCPCFCLLLSLSSILFYLVPSCFPTLSRTVFFTVLSLHLSLALSQFGNRA